VDPRRDFLVVQVFGITVRVDNVMEARVIVHGSDGTPKPTVAREFLVDFGVNAVRALLRHLLAYYWYRYWYRSNGSGIHFDGGCCTNFHETRTKHTNTIRTNKRRQGSGIDRLESEDGCKVAIKQTDGQRQQYYRTTVIYRKQQWIQKYWCDRRKGKQGNLGGGKQGGTLTTRGVTTLCVTKCHRYQDVVDNLVLLASQLSIDRTTFDSYPQLSMYCDTGGFY